MVKLISPAKLQVGLTGKFTALTHLSIEVHSALYQDKHKISIQCSVPRLYLMILSSNHYTGLRCLQSLLFLISYKLNDIKYIII